VPVKVQHLVWEFPPVIYGGLARHAEQLVRAQQAAGVDVTVVTAAEDVTDSSRRVPHGARTRRGIPVIRARRPAPRAPWTHLLQAASELDGAMAEAGLRLAKSDPPDVVHAHDWIGSRAGRRIADLAGARYVLTVHATEWGRRQGRIDEGIQDGVPAAIHALERRAVAEADAVIVCSSAMREEICDVLGAPADRVTVVPNAVDVSAWRCGPGSIRAAREYWLDRLSVPGGLQQAGPSAGPLVAAAGRLEWEKGFSTLIRALPDLREAYPGVRAVLAGRGSYQPDLERLAADLGVTGVLVLPGWLGRRDLAALYAAADVVVVPSRYEPSGLVVREAQAAGATVIATATGGLSDAVRDGVTGALIGVGDVHALRDTVVGLTGDPAAARRLAQAGAAAVAKLTWAQVATATSAVYQPAGAHRTARDDMMSR
jgi:glycogen(starch) synthase